MGKKKKDDFRKADIIVNTIGITLLSVVWGVLALGLIMFIKALMKVPSEEFTSKLCFIGISIVFLVSWFIFKFLPKQISGLSDEISKIKLGGKNGEHKQRTRKRK